ncbi:hypothetical protein [Sphingomonas sp. 35-24ZXX]|uniref:hypothetical protein n=1 Tax=Sphingomonas sp. 35-24ZXX TaxID=1545915 RepID=UPI00053BE804|nr:hypothetical protein [Sphingomonas sp. 35-24ZXX]
MVQLVFVHGVATRSGPGYAQGLANRDALFRKVAFEGREVTILSPLWGDLVPSINPKVFGTDEGVRSFSIGAPVGDGQTGGLGGAPGPGGADLAAVARQNPTVAIDAVFAQAVGTADSAGVELTAEDLAAFRLAARAIESDDAPARVGAAATDADLARSLGDLGANSFGIGSRLANAVSVVSGRIRNTASTVAFGTVRDFISPAVGMFLGDVFAYLQQGRLRDRIQEVVRTDLVQAHEASLSGKGPVVVVAHSMGGVILSDMLQDLAASGLPADLQIAALFTVGSQPGLFKAVGVLSGSAGPDGKTPRPACVGAWFNVFDPIDPLAFRADALYSGVDDLAFDSVTGLASAHTTYFSRPQFHARFRRRLADLSVI